MSKLKISAINKVPYYGKGFPFLPRNASVRRKQSTAFMKTQFKEMGVFPTLGFWLAFPFRIKGIYSQYGEALDIAQKSFGKAAKTEWALLFLAYNKMSKLKGGESAYAFVKKSIQAAAPEVMSDMYQADDLAKFDDPFEAFWDYHKAMFKGDENYPNYFIEDGEDGAKEMIVTSCRNCEIAYSSIPALAKMGCDNDCAGYPAISEQTQMDFRRPTTIAKGGDVCRFMFFRKGTAPAGLETK